MSSASRDPPFRLLDLPSELLGNVCEQLDDNDLISVHFACRAMKVHSTNAFGIRFFQYLFAFLHPLSLITLLETTRHPTLCKFVKHVSISSERIGLSVTDVTMDSKIESQHRDLQLSMEKSGADELLLTETFRALSNLRIVRIDKESYFHKRTSTFPDVKLHYGRHYFRRASNIEGIVFNPELEDDHVYRLAVSILEKIDPQERFQMEFHFLETIESHFSTKEAFVSTRTIYVRISGIATSRWIYRLLYGAMDVRGLNLNEFC